MCVNKHVIGDNSNSISIFYSNFRLFGSDNVDTFTAKTCSQD